MMEMKHVAVLIVQEKKNAHTHSMITHLLIRQAQRTYNEYVIKRRSYQQLEETAVTTIPYKDSSKITTKAVVFAQRQIAVFFSVALCRMLTSHTHLTARMFA